MKKVQWLGLAAFMTVFTACNGSNDNNAKTDSTAVTTTTTENSSTGNYAALADTFRVNSEAGNYLDTRTGKPIRIKYDATTRRAINEETNQPVWRYVDRRTWWVYGPENNNWNRIGEARMEGDKLQYKGENDAWIGYDERWKSDDERWMSDTAYMGGTGGSMDNNSNMSGSSSDMGSNSGMSSDGKTKVSDNGNKVKDENIKVKAGKDGDLKIKDRQTGEKVKYNADNGKVKSGN